MRTVIGRNRRRRKELEPSRRLSETTGPRSPCAFRVVFPATEVTKRGASGRRHSSHIAHRSCDRYRNAQAPPHMFRAAPRTCYRSAGMGSAGAGVQGDGSPFTCYRERGRPMDQSGSPRAFGPCAYGRSARNELIDLPPLSIGTLQCWPCSSAPARHLQTTSQAALFPLTRRHSDARLPPL